MEATRHGPSAATLLLERIERTEALDDLGARLQSLAEAIGHGSVGDLLRGRPVGHALHPVMVQLPIGALVSAVILDLGHGARAGRQSRLLMGVACLSSVPALLSGMAEWAHADERTRRVGVVHLGLNLVATGACAASYLLRRAGRSRSGVVLAGVAGTAAGVGGFVGGHLSLVRKYASHDAPSDLEGVRSGNLG